MFKKVESRQKFPEMEKEIIEFWKENKTFQKSLENRKDAKEYTFYDGPPFATGTPHYGHLVGSIMKDAVPRYWTMRGFYVERKWGWDCHGLPIENIVEKEMGSQKKKDIEALGVDKFNELCRSKVLGYVDVWEKTIERMGRWADMKNAYRTMDKDFMESVWWVFKELFDKGLVYESYRSMHICPRCETTLSQSEVAEGYQDIKDLSVTAKFELLDENGEGTNTFILAWTTTPWTLPGNIALAVNPDEEYGIFEVTSESGINSLNTGDRVIFQKSDDCIMRLFQNVAIYENPKRFVAVDQGGAELTEIKTIKGKDLIGKKYKPLFNTYAENESLENRENGWKVYGADFVTTEDGTGVVHIAPAFGEDDMNLGKENNLPFVQHVGMDGQFADELEEGLAGLNVKPIENHQATDIEIIKNLAKKGLLFSKKKYEHSYPHCWRCDTPLINYATSSWFIAVTKVKDKLLETAKKVNWSPAHLKEGRFGNWLEGARDWSISRQRFWASAIPIWKCECGEMKVFGNVTDLEKISGEKIDDLHKHVVDKIVFDCEKCDGKMHRIPDVLDTWFDSGSMPYAQKHYPFENKEKFEATFPADFIAEGIDQTRAWFYYLHTIAGAIKGKSAFKNVIANGIVLAEDGKKMSKKLQNYPDPMEMFEKYGADAVRYYLMASPVVVAQNLNFSEKEVGEVVRGMMRMLWNSYSFFVLYANIDKWEAKEKFSAESKSNLLDKWIVSELQVLIRDFNVHMEAYELHKAARLLPKFTDNLSNWYIRRSRKRFWKSEDDDDKNDAYATLHYVLIELSKVMAPFTPFIAEEIYRNLMNSVETKDLSSVHLTDFPKTNEGLIDEKLNKQVQDLRNVISEGLQLRSQNKLKVRQPLSEVTVKKDFSEEMQEIIKEELNIKEVIFDKNLETDIVLDIEITPELRLEGQAREIIRHIQQMRKNADYQVDDRINVSYQGGEEVFEKFGKMIAKEVLAEKFEKGNLEEFDLEKELDVDGEMVVVRIKK
ncbi:MAG: isoleucine--tRNA ligase [Candidatus Moranbacteria bacterium]|nr:isoleucine--tRNA ligase [Candidatus Moranbacteria bacterium]